MRLEKRLYIQGYKYQIVDDDVVLRLNDAGKASFEVMSDKVLSGVVIFEIRYTTSRFVTIFNGYISSCTRRSKESFILQCKGIAHALKLPCSVSLRSCSLTDVMSRVSELTALKIEIGKASYASNIEPRFASTGSGYDVLSNVSRVFGIKRLCWQSLDNGNIWLGDWNDSKWYDRPISLDASFYQKQQNNQATMPCITSLRPGVMLNGSIVSEVRFTKNISLVTWKK